MSQNRFFGLDLLPEDNIKIVAQINSRFIEKNSDLHVVFENNRIDWPKLQRIEPFTVARHDFDRDGPEEGMPQEVTEHLHEPGWKCLVWLPFEVAHGDLNRFTLRYAHELQHYRQLLGAESLTNARNFLAKLRREGFKPIIKTEKDPREFDADVVSFDTFEAIHGCVSLQNFIKSEAADPEMRNFFERVLPLRDRFKSECQNESV